MLNANGTVTITGGATLTGQAGASYNVGDVETFINNDGGDAFTGSFGGPNFIFTGQNFTLSEVGGDGNDALYGDAGNDHLEGGDGNDILKRASPELIYTVVSIDIEGDIQLSNLCYVYQDCLREYNV